MITICILSPRPRCFTATKAVELKRLLFGKQTVWVDFSSPDEQEAQLLAEVFKFHQLSIEDCFDDIHYPKLEQFSNYLFVILHVLEPGSKSRPTTEVDFFIGNNFLVTVHLKPSAVLETAREHLLVGAMHGLKSPDMLFQVLASRFVDEYFPLLDELDDQIDSMEDKVFKWNRGGQIDSPGLINQFLVSKKRITTLRRLLTPQRDVFSRLSRNEFKQISSTTALYFRDIYDRLFRITEMLDSFRDILSSTLEAHLSVVSNRLNEIMKVLTVVTVIILPMTVVTGIYGMNFRFMPELQSPWGYPATIAMMTALAFLMVWYFKRRKWL